MSSPTKKVRAKAGYSRAARVVPEPAPEVPQVAGAASTDTQEIRERAGFSQLRAAALANVALATWRVFEIDPTRLRRKSRAACERALVIIRGASEAA